MRAPLPIETSLRGRMKLTCALLACLALLTAANATGRSSSGARARRRSRTSSRTPARRRNSSRSRRSGRAPRREPSASGSSAATARPQVAGPVDGVARHPRHLRAQARRRPQDPERGVRDPAGHVRARAESGRSLSLPPHRLRRLVGRGSALTVLQQVPSRALRGETAVPDHERGHVQIAHGLPPPGGDRLQHATRSSRGAARASSSTSATAVRRSAASASALPQLVKVLRWFDPTKRPLIVIGTRSRIRTF